MKQDRQIKHRVQERALSRSWNTSWLAAGAAFCVLFGSGKSLWAQEAVAEPFAVTASPAAVVGSNGSETGSVQIPPSIDFSQVVLGRMPLLDVSLPFQGDTNPAGGVGSVSLAGDTAVLSPSLLSNGLKPEPRPAFLTLSGVGATTLSDVSQMTIAPGALVRISPTAGEVLAVNGSSTSGNVLSLSGVELAKGTAVDTGEIRLGLDGPYVRPSLSADGSLSVSQPDIRLVVRDGVVYYGEPPADRPVTVPGNTAVDLQPVENPDGVPAEPQVVPVRLEFKDGVVWEVDRAKIVEKDGVLYAPSDVGSLTLKALGSVDDLEKVAPVAHAGTPDDDTTFQTLANQALEVTAPTIVEQPKSAKVLSGRNVVLSVSVSGGGELAYQWLKNGAELADQTGPELKLTASASAVGSYSVKITNEKGSVTSEAATVEIVAPAQLKGVYQGLLQAWLGESENAENVGRVTITMTGQTAFSGRLDYAGTTYRFRGELDDEFVFEKTLTASRKPPVDLVVSLDDSGAALSVTVQGGQLGEDTLAATVLKRTEFNAASSAVAVGSRMTAVLSENSDEASCRGYVTTTLAQSGIVSVSGKAADGSSMVSSAYLQADGTLALYSELFGAQNSFPGQMCGKSSLVEAKGEFTEIAFAKPARGQVVTTYESVRSVNLEGSAYVAPSKDQPLVLQLNDPAAPLDLLVVEDSGEEFTSQVTLGAGNKFNEQDPKPLKFRVTLNPLTGELVGRYTEPGSSGVTKRVFGVVLQSKKEAAGFWYGSGQNGWWSLTSAQSAE